MAALERRGPRGLLRIVAQDPETRRAAAELASQWESLAPPARGTVLFAGRLVHLKFDQCEGAARFANAWRALLRPRAIPRLCEHANLVWLHDRLFQAPRPIAAGVSTRRGLPCFQFLLCEAIAEAETLAVFLRHAARGREPRSAPAAERERVLTELAREMARMHALRFVHGRLTPEKILVGPASELARIHFLDPSRGGPRLSTRGAARDLSCFVARTPGLLSAPEIGAFVALYVDERRAQGRPVDPTRVARAIERSRGLENPDDPRASSRD